MSLAHFYPVIVAGGRGTRFWPRSRTRRPKQLLALDSTRTMLQQTAARLAALAPPRRFWVITGSQLKAPIARQLPRVPRKHIIAEPVGRNTAPAAGLAAFLLLRDDPDAVLGMFPADHVIADPNRFRQAVLQAVEVAAAGPNMVIMGIAPTRPETGYGYIETGEEVGPGLRRVRRFTEKPDAARAREFLSAGNYQWNSGMFVWRAQTLADLLREHLPHTAALLEQIAAARGTGRFKRTLARLYRKVENISVDYAVAEPQSAKGEAASNLYCITADFGWSDLGSWAALYEHRAAAFQDGANIVEADGRFEVDSAGNYVHAPRKFVATVGVKDLVVVETGDALLITTRDRAQDVGKIVKHLEAKRRKDLL
ncbi:MAG TPA: sugar phosphate nucleotidyltransferase [Terriglobales bacterium]|nr:sugar phosphate nucleotidyltransferase [Terriglobales bacterium]